MKTALLLALAVLLGSGCFQPRFSSARTCKVGRTTIELEKDTGCDYYVATVEGAFAENVRRGFISRAEADAVEVTVWVQDDYPTVLCDDGSYAAGCTAAWPSGTEVQVTKTGGAVMHELLHVVEHMRGTPDAVSSDHVDWNTRGAAPGADSYPDEHYREDVLDGSWLNASQRFLIAADYACPFTPGR